MALEAVPTTHVKLFYNGSNKLETTNTGVDITGILNASDGIKLTDADNLSILLGASEDMRIRHTGSHSEITDEGTGHLRLGGGQVRIGDATFSKNAAIFDASANTRLYFDNTLRFETTNTGAVVTGILTATSMEPSKISLGDNERISVGLSSDLSIYHDGSQSIIADTGTGQLAIRGGVTVSISNAAGTEVMANFINGGAVNLFHNGTNRLATTNTGVDVNGDVRVGSGITLSPDGDIFAVGVSTFTDEIHLTTTGNTLRFKDDSGNQLGAIAGNSSNLGFFGNANNNGRFDFYTGGAYRFRIQPGGDINVGTAVTIGGVTGHARYTGIVTTHGADINGDLDVSGTATLASGSSGQVILQYQGSTKLATQSWGVQATGTFQAIGNLEALNSSSQTDGKDIHIKNVKSGGGVKNVLTLSHESNNSSITGHVGNISINAPQVSISTHFSVAGVSTLTGTVGFGTHITLEDDAEIRLGERVSGGNRVGDFIIRHDPDMFSSVYNVIQSNNGNIQIENRDTAGATRFLYLKSDAVQVRSYTGNEAFIQCTRNQDVKLYYDNVEKLATSSSGAVVYGDLTVSGSVSEGSDIRLKTNIKPIEDPIDKVTQIEGVSFNWKKDNKPALGVIADQVEKIIPELVQGDDPKTVNYNGLIGLLIEAVKDQQTQIDSLKERLSKLE